jgi:general stress protein 26
MTTATTSTTAASTAPSLDEIRAAIGRRSFATLSTASPKQRPHAAGVIYAVVDDRLYVSTLRSSRKARNIAANSHVFVNISVRRVPFGAPPSSIQFAGTAELLDVDHAEVTSLAATGRLKTITSHGELDLPDGCIVRITPGDTVHTYGLGMSLWALARNPLDAAGRVERSASMRA